MREAASPLHPRERYGAKPGNPLHPAALAAFFASLLREGVPQSDIDRMSKTNPARALGLN